MLLSVSTEWDEPIASAYQFPISIPWGCNIISKFMHWCLFREQGTLDTGHLTSHLKIVLVISFDEPLHSILLGGSVCGAARCSLLRYNRIGVALIIVFCNPLYCSGHTWSQTRELYLLFIWAWLIHILGCISEQSHRLMEVISSIFSIGLEFTPSCAKLVPRIHILAICWSNVLGLFN